MYQIRTLNEISDIIYSELPGDRYSVAKDAADAQAILVRSADMHSMQMPASLLAVARAGAGVNNIPTEDCANQGIVVFNTPGANANAVKELVLAGLLLSGRKIIEGVAWAQSLAGQTDVAKLVEKGKNQFVGPELRGKRMGVIGLGAIGAMVANDCRALGMEVYGYDPFISVENAWGLSRSVKRSTSLDEIIMNSDYISVHVPLMDKTRGMFSTQAFDKMKEGCVLLNFSRGELVDNVAVKKALENGALRQYVTDFPNEDLLNTSGILCIPHLGASTPESEENCAQMAASQLRLYLESGNIQNSVNLPDCFLPRTASADRITLIHQNITNMVGQITAILAAEGINIADMLNKSRGSIAYTIIDSDQVVPAAVLEKLTKIEGVIRVRKIG